MGVVEKIKDMCENKYFCLREEKNCLFVYFRDEKTVPLFVIYLSNNFIAIDSCVPLSTEDVCSHTVVYETGAYETMLSELKSCLIKLKTTIMQLIHLPRTSQLVFKKTGSFNYIASVNENVLLQISLQLKGFSIQLCCKAGTVITQDILLWCNEYSKIFGVPINLVFGKDKITKSCVLS